MKKQEPARRPLSDCGACSGTGRVHIQHKRPFRVESRECDCWRVVELADCATDRTRRGIVGTKVGAP